MLVSPPSFPSLLPPQALPALASPSQSMSDSAPLPSPPAAQPSAPLPAPPQSILLSRSPSSFSSPTAPQPQTHKGGILLQPTVSRSNGSVMTPSTAGPATRVVSSSGSRITFAPLPPPPPEDEKRRRNSISVGVAARGQILRSQGATGKKANNNGVIYVPMTDEEWEAYKDKFNKSQGIPSEVPDLGTLAMKGGRKLLSSIRRSMSSSSTTSSTTSNASNKATAAGVSAPPTIAPIPVPPPFQRTSSTLSTSSTGPVPSSPESSEAFSLSPTSQLEPPLLPSPPPELDNDEEFDESPILDGEGRRPSFSIRARAYSPPPLESYEPTPEEYGFGMSSAGSTSGSSILEEDEDEEEEEEEEEEKKLNTAGAGNTTPKRRGSFSGLEHLHLGGHGGAGEDGEGSSTPMGKTSFVLGFETLTTSGPLKEDVESWRKERRASQGSRGSGDEERRRSGSGEEKR